MLFNLRWLWTCELKGLLSPNIFIINLHSFQACDNGRYSGGWTQTITNDRYADKQEKAYHDVGTTKNKDTSIRAYLKLNNIVGKYRLLDQNV